MTTHYFILTLVFVGGGAFVGTIVSMGITMWAEARRRITSRF